MADLVWKTSEYVRILNGTDVQIVLGEHVITVSRDEAESIAYGLGKVVRLLKTIDDATFGYKD